MSEPIDHTELATSSVPFARRGTVRDTGERLAADIYMSVYTAGLDLLEDQAQELDRWINEWRKPGADTPAWVLDAIGNQLGFPRPDGAEERELFRRLLNLQVIARTAGGRREGIRELFDEIAQPYGTGTGSATVDFPGLNSVVVTLLDSDPLATLPGVDRIIEAAIGEVDLVSITQAASGIFFTFGVQGLGFDQGVFA